MRTLHSHTPLEAMELVMEITDGIRWAMEQDLGLNAQYTFGQNIAVKRCWHFSTDGNLVDFLFNDDEDFVAGTNRIFTLVGKYQTVVLAYCLMGTHVHFILWGEFDQCNKFMHDYIKLTSMYLSNKYGDRHKLRRLVPSHQQIGNDGYLKKAICYVLKNPPAGGIPFTAQDYPWSSGSLYFRKDGYWTFSDWEPMLTDSSALSLNKLRQILRTRDVPDKPFKLIGDIVFPGEFVPVDIVEGIFRTHKGFHYLMCISKESDIESVQSFSSRLSIPYPELQQHKTELCRETFGVASIRALSTDQRFVLAKMLRARYNCSLKQIAKTCGLVYEEVKSKHM